MITIKVGSTFRSSGGQIYNITQMLAHPQWMGRGDGDLGLVKLNETVNHPNASIINLPAENETLATGTNLTVTGWGDTYGNSTTGSEILQEVTVPIVSHEDCATAYINDRITEYVLCAGLLDTGGKGSCGGDSGGPAVANNKVFGVVSRGTECARAGYPGIYTNVASYVSWIKNVTGI